MPLPRLCSVPLIKFGVHLILLTFFWHFVYSFSLLFVAQENGRFVEEIVSVPVKGKKGPEEFKVDEHPKPNSTIESLAKLPAVFKKDGTITAANASVRYFYAHKSSGETVVAISCFFFVVRPS